jgi:hypothetical protein
MSHSTSLINKILFSILVRITGLSDPVLPGASEALLEPQLHIADLQIMEIFLVTFLIPNQCVL